MRDREKEREGEKEREIMRERMTEIEWEREIIGGWICHIWFALQVCSVLESLEQEYKREEDWCGGADKLGPNCETDHVTPMISKHLEQKEAFLKVQYPSGYSICRFLMGSNDSHLCVCVCVRLLSGMHPGQTKCWCVSKVHAQEQCEHAWDAESRQSTWAAGQKWVYRAL